MPRLSDLTDYNYDPMGSAVPAELPVDKPFKDLKKVYITGEEDLPVKFSDEPVKGDSGSFSNNVDKILNSLFRPDEKRLQLWPEKLLRSGTTAAGNVMSGEIPQWAVDPATGDVHTSPQMVEAAQEMSALAGTGGLGGTGGTLNATPSLRPALKHNGKLYKGKPGQEHMDVIPESMYPDFQKKAMNGEDIKEYNFGFINDKGHFLNREDALKYGIDNGLIDPQAGKFGALTSTLFADSSKPGAAIEAMKTANPFFSALEHNVSQINQTKMTGDQWLGTLGNKPGVKPEELQWTGLADFLNENKGKPVTKAQIEEHLAANKVELKEVTKGTGELKAAAEGLQAAVGNDKISVANHRDKLYADEIEQGLWSGDITPKDLPTNLQPHAEKMLSLRHQQESPTKYSSYQLPGGENYREMLMTLPNKPTAKISFDDYLKQTSIKSKEEMSPAALEIARKRYEKEGQNVLNPDVYRSSHWDEPNILAHVRMNDRTMPGEGYTWRNKASGNTSQTFANKEEAQAYFNKNFPNGHPKLELVPAERPVKSLHLEEIQSDWHQQGREKGYASEQKQAMGKVQDLIKEASTLSPSDARYKEIYKELPQWQSKANERAVPDAPFKKSWHELALKRMLREASEKGYDRLSWTPGEAQAARYDLSKSVSTVVYKDGKLTAIGPSGQHVINNQIVGKDKLADYIGKEAAEKLLKQEPHNGAHTLQGEQLKIGGEGMKGFYDQIIPKALEKLGKEHGVKVKQTGVDVSGGKTLNSRDHSGAFEDGVAQVHYIDIPQSLKDTATQKGFPLFSAGGYMLMPVVGNPFEDKK